MSKGELGTRENQWLPVDAQRRGSSAELGAMFGEERDWLWNGQVLQS